MHDHRFEIDGTTFYLRHLKPKQSLRGLNLVTTILLPALAEGATAAEGSLGNAAERVVGGLSCLPELLDLFVPAGEFTDANRANPTDLQPFIDDVFQGRPDVMLAYLVHGIKHEYERFLDGSALQTLAAAMGMSSASLKALIGSFGESPQTSESPTDSET